MVASLWPTRRLLPEIGRRLVAAGLDAIVLTGECRGDGNRWLSVAREYGLPAVVNVPGVFRHIKDGETLTEDGDAATVSRIP